MSNFKSSQYQIERDNTNSLVERENAVKYKEAELRKKEDAIERQKLDIQSERDQGMYITSFRNFRENSNLRLVQKLVLGLNTQLKELQSSNEEEKKRLQLELKNFEMRVGQKKTQKKTDPL